MRRFAPVALVLSLLTTAGCGGSAAAVQPGTIVFGTAEAHHQIQHPTTAFGPDDILAYVAHLSLDRTIAPHHRFHEIFTRVRNDGKESRVLDDYFTLNTPVLHYITFHFPVAQLYKVGFTAPGRYRIRLLHAGNTIAQGQFQLK